MRKFMKKYLVYLYSAVLFVVFLLNQFFILVNEAFVGTTSSLPMNSIDMKVILLYALVVIVLTILLYCLPLMIFITNEIKIDLPNKLHIEFKVNVNHTMYHKKTFFSKSNNIFILRC